MYNADIKEIYIEKTRESTPTAEVFQRRFFNKAEKYEELWQEDLCNWNMDQIIEFYISLASRTGQTIYNINSIFKKYTNYCISINFTKTSFNYYEEINDDVIFKACTNNTAMEERIITRKELMDKIAFFANASDKYLCLALFEGICGAEKSELMNVELQHINGTVITLEPSKRELTISPELIVAIKDSCDEYEYSGVNDEGVAYTQKFEHTSGAYKNFVVVRRGAQNDKARAISRRLKKIDPYLTTKALLDSGKIDMCKRLMEEKHITFEQALKDEDVVYRYGITKSVKQFVYKYENKIRES